MIQLISAFLYAGALPGEFVSLHHYTDRISRSVALPSDYYFQSYDRVEIALYFARIAGLVLFAFFFWTCGPRIERLLLPMQEARDEAGSTPE